MIHYPHAKTCRHLEGDAVYSNDGLIIESGEDEQDLLVLCPLCAKLVREKVLSEIFTAAVKEAVKDNLSSLRVRY